MREFSLGLVALGLQRGDKVAIVGDNRPEWVFAELAALCAGAVPLGIYQDSTTTEVGYVIDHSDAVFVVAEDQEQVDKILELKEKIPKVRSVDLHRPQGDARLHRLLPASTSPRSRSAAANSTRGSRGSSSGMSPRGPAATRR